MTDTSTYEIDLQAAAWRVEQEGFAPHSGLYCMVIAKTPQEAATIALDITGDTVQRVAGPYLIKSTGSYINRP